MGTLTFETLAMPAANLKAPSPLAPLAPPHKAQAARADMEDAKKLETLDQHSFAARYPGLALRKHCRMPYSLLDEYDRARSVREFKVAVMENDHLRAVFLLEHGGRLWSLDHKPTGTNLVAPNPIFQPANLAMRGSWYSGGVEWNATPGGHTPLTLDPHFTAVTQLDDGEPVLRIYEWERICQIGYQIDFWLPDDSEFLFARVRVTNPHDHEIPMYWWTNIAVDEGEGMRVIVPATDAKSWGYGGAEQTVNVPILDDVDISYSTNLPGICDFYYGIRKPQRPWLAYLNPQGRGLTHPSTSRLTGRKLFTWGMFEGGRHWQGFLTEDRPYIELQAGLIQTQYETIPMAGGEDWDWIEGFGYVEIDPAKAHGEWAQAGKAVNDHLEDLLPQDTLEAMLVETRPMSERPADRFVMRGAGWGALEDMRRAKTGQAPGHLPSLVFDEASLTDEQKPWLELLNDGAMPQVDPACPPVTFMGQAEWQDMLEDAVTKACATNWFAWYQLGNMRYAEDPDGAKAAWETSLSLAPNAWAKRNLAIYWYHREDYAQASEEFLAAHKLAPRVLQLAKECCKAMVWAGRFEDILAWWPDLDDTIRGDERMKTMWAAAMLETGRTEGVGEYLETPKELADLQEAEVILSNLWIDYHTLRLAKEQGVEPNDAIRQRVEVEFPVPEHLDFRVRYKIGKDKIEK
jgi:hypothetical protein